MPTNNQCQYCEWDEDSFILPAAYILNENSDLADALKVFYSVGGYDFIYDFFRVDDPRYYASRWREFVGNLFGEIMEEKYVSRNVGYRNPLSEVQKQELTRRGAPDVFIKDIPQTPWKRKLEFLMHKFLGLHAISV